MASANLEYANRNLVAAITRPEYLDYIKGNHYAEADPEHFLNVGDLVKHLWECKYGIPTPEGVIIAGWYHDFDRVFPNRMIDTRNTPPQDYAKAKAAHSRNCAIIFEEHNPELPRTLVKDVKFLIERHEVGGDRANGVLINHPDEFTDSYNLNQGAEELCEADGLSFFPVILPYYAAWADESRVRQKIIFSYEKLSDVGKEIVKSLKFGDQKIERLLRESIGTT